MKENEEEKKKYFQNTLLSGVILIFIDETILPHFIYTLKNLLVLEDLVSELYLHIYIKFHHIIFILHDILVLCDLYFSGTEFHNLNAIDILDSIMLFLWRFVLYIVSGLTAGWA